MNGPTVDEAPRAAGPRSGEAAARIPFVAPDATLRGCVVTFDGRAAAEVPFAQLAEDVVRARERLLRAELEPGACVGVLGENCFEWMVYDLALMSLGYIAVPFPVDEFAPRAPEELADDYDLSLVLVTRKSAGGRLRPWMLVMDDSDAPPATARPVAGGALRRRVQGTDACTLIFSSGTSGQLKGLVLSRAGVDSTVQALADGWAMGPDDRILVALPLSVFQQRVMIYAALRTDTTILLTDSANLFRSFKAVRPTIVLGPPALFETVEKRFRVLPAARRRRLALLGGMMRALPARMRSRLCARVFWMAHEAFGGRVRVLLTGSAPSKRSTLEFYEMAGLPLFQCYGLAEVGFIAWNLPGRNRLMSVGHPVVPGSVSLADDGEVVVSLAHPQAIGYFGVDAAEEARTFLPERRIATGDLGRFDRDGYLHLTGRKKNVIVTQAGEKIQPEALEHGLGRVAGVERVVVVGGGDVGGLVAIVAIDPRTGVEDEERIRADVQAAIDTSNARVKPGWRIGRFVVTRVAFVPENGLVTRNLKLDRAAVYRFFERELLGAQPGPQGAYAS